MIELAADDLLADAFHAAGSGCAALVVRRTSTTVPGSLHTQLEPEDRFVTPEHRTQPVRERREQSQTKIMGRAETLKMFDNRQNNRYLNCVAS